MILVFTLGFNSVTWVFVTSFNGDTHPAPSLTRKNGIHPSSPVWKWPLFSRQSTDVFSSKRPLICDKALTFQSKMNPLFCGKTLTCQPKWTPIFTVKHWTSKITPFLQIHEGEYQNTLFSKENANPGFPKKNNLYSRILELGCLW